MTKRKDSRSSPVCCSRADVEWNAEGTTAICTNDACRDDDGVAPMWDIEEGS